MRIRFTTGTILWLTLLLAICMGWLIDGIWHRRQLRRLNEYEEFRQKVVADLEVQLQYCIKVNKEQYAERQELMNMLREKGTLNYSDVYPTRGKRNDRE